MDNIQWYGYSLDRLDQYFFSLRPKLVGSKINAQSSWAWKKILKLRPLFQPKLKCDAGNGQKIFLWYDNWHPKGHPIQAYRSQDLQEVQILLCNNLYPTNQILKIRSNGSLWNTILARTGKDGAITIRWHQIVQWLYRALKRETKTNLITKLAWQACIYQIWLERLQIWLCKTPEIEYIVFQIIHV